MTSHCPLKLRILTSSALLAAIFSVHFSRAQQTPGLRTVSFLPGVLYNSGGIFATSVAVADVNGDGKPDLLVGNGYDGTIPNNGGVGILLGKGDGTFQPAITHDTGGPGSFANSVVVADINGDGKADLIVVNSCGNSFCGPSSGSSVAVSLGNGDGTFQQAVAYNSGGSAWSLKLMDVNHDSKLDIIVANANGSVGVLLGNGDGTFKKAETYASGGSGSYSIAVMDVNGDGAPDLIVTNLCFGTCSSTRLGGIGVLLGNGDGTFQSVITYRSAGFANAVAAADLNGDGKADLVVTNASSAVGTVAVLLGNGDGTFQSPVTYSGGSYPDSIAIADVNGDGKPDLVVATGAYNTIGNAAALLGNGDGTFEPLLTFSSLEYGADAIAVADVNGDGRPDLLVVNDCTSAGCLGTQEGTIAVLLNTTPFCTTAPVITVSTTPTSLWPPNGKMMPVTVSGTITDPGCTVTSSAYAVTDEYGQVQPSGEVTLGAGGAYSFTVLLQASRLGTDLDGRLYTITVSANNNAGEAGSQASDVIVPHDQGR
jgi:FG-GAP-like repeat/FG-GAP repeat